MLSSSFAKLFALLLSISQAETEELAVKVQALNSENMTLKSEMNKLMECSEKLKLENAALLVRCNTQISLFSVIPSLNL